MTEPREIMAGSTRCVTYMNHTGDNLNVRTWRRSPAVQSGLLRGSRWFYS